MRIKRSFLAALFGCAIMLLAFTGSVAAHVHLQAGNYDIALGWAVEPTFVGELNAVQVLIADQNGNPVTDLGPGDLQVVVSAGGQASDPLAVEPAFDVDEGLGTPGDYRADVIPTSPTDYTFHLTGSIHGQAVDFTATSAADTFDTPTDPSAIQFPDKLPAVADLSTRIERVDSRSASDSQTALYVGAGLGIAGIVIGLAALALAYRGRRRAGA